jgi:adenylate cyclase
VLQWATVSATGVSSDLAGKAAEGRRLIAVVYADMVNYSRLIGLDDAGTLRRLRTLRRALIDPAIREHGGKVVQTGGDSLLIAFDSIDGAVRCAVKVQQQVPVYDGDQPPGRRIRFRVGINIGDVIPEGTNLHGDGVNIAARLEGVCPVGGICISRSVKDHVHGRLGLSFTPIGSLTLKNVARPVEAFTVRLDVGANATPANSGIFRRLWRSCLRPRVLVPIAVVCLVAVGYALVGSGELLQSGQNWLWGTEKASDRRPPRLVATTKQETQGRATDSQPPLLKDQPSIAVLRFKNLSGDRDQEYFSDGMADDLVTALSRFRSLFVFAKNVGFAYQSGTSNAQKVANEIGAHYALEGSVRVDLDRVRVSVQMIDALQGNYIWAERYDRKITDIFAVQDDITEAVARAILPKLEQAERDRALRKPPQSLSAWEAYQRGLWHISRLGGADNEEAKRLFRQAIDQDPSFARAYSALATSYNRDVVALRMAPEDAAVIAEPLARKAVDLDDADANAHLALARILLFQKGDYSSALAEAQRALELNNNLALAHSVMGMVLTFSGRPQDGLAYAKRGFDLDPRNPNILPAFHVLIPLYFLHDYNAALDFAQTALRLYGPFGHSFYWLAAISAQLGRVSEAREALLKAEALKAVPYGMSSTGETLPFMRRQDLDHELEGLQKAGWQR